MPWKAPATSQLERRIHELQIRLLKANAELRMKSIYAERLEVLLHQRNERIDQLTATIDQLRVANQQLDHEADRWARLFATNGEPAPLTAREEQHNR